METPESRPSPSVKVTYRDATRKFPSVPLSLLLPLVVERFAATEPIQLESENGVINNDSELEAVIREGRKLRAVPAASAAPVQTPIQMVDTDTDAQMTENPFEDIAQPPSEAAQVVGQQPQVPPVQVTEKDLETAMEELVGGGSASGTSSTSVPGAFPEHLIGHGDPGIAPMPPSSSSTGAQPQPAPSASTATPTAQPILPLLRTLFATVRRHWDTDPELRGQVQAVVDALGTNAAGVVRSLGVNVAAGQEGLRELAGRLGSTVETWAAEWDARRAQGQAGQAAGQSGQAQAGQPGQQSPAASALSVAFVVAQQVASVIGDIARRAFASAQQAAQQAGSQPAFDHSGPPPPPHPHPPPPHMFPPPPPGAFPLPFPPRGFGPPGSFPPPGGPFPPPSFPAPPAGSQPPSPLSILHATEIARIREMGLAQGLSDEEVGRMVQEGGVEGAVGRLV